MKGNDSMASVGLFFGSDTGNTEAVAKMIQKQLSKQLVHVQDIAKAAKKISITSIYCCLVSLRGTTAKHNVIGMTSSLS